MNNNNKYVLESFIQERYGFGKLKYALGAASMGAWNERRIERMYYHCNTIPDKYDMLKCQSGVLKQVINILKTQSAKEKDIDVKNKLNKQIAVYNKRLQSIQSGLSEGAVKGFLKYTGVNIPYVAAGNVFDMILLSAGLPPVMNLVLSVINSLHYGNMVQNRINTLYYECKNITSQTEKLECKQKISKFVVGVLNKSLNDCKSGKHNCSASQIKKIEQELARYNVILNKKKDFTSTQTTYGNKRIKFPKK